MSEGKYERDDRDPDIMPCITRPDGSRFLELEADDELNRLAAEIAELRSALEGLYELVADDEVSVPDRLYHHVAFATSVMTKEPSR